MICCQSFHTLQPLKKKATDLLQESTDFKHVDETIGRVVVVSLVDERKVLQDESKVRYARRLGLLNNSTRSGICVCKRWGVCRESVVIGVHEWWHHPHHQIIASATKARSKM